MKRIGLDHLAKAPDTAVLAGDVCRDRIDAYSELGGVGLEWDFENTPRELRAALVAFGERARLAGKARILVVVESTGAYSELVLRIAQELDFHTAWVSTEAVCKMRGIESNDSSKTDPKDARCIYRLAAVMGKTLRHRALTEEYGVLRELHLVYASAEEAVVVARNAAQDVLRRLFPGFGFKSGFLFGKSGHALVSCYGADPARILATDEAEFTATMRAAAKGIHGVSLRRLRSQAEACSTSFLSEELASVLVLRMRQLFEDLERHDARKAAIKARMVALYEALRLRDPALPEATRGVVSAFHLARIVAETGPLSDFESWRQVMRLAGLNLTERKSGTWKGRTKLSKKGRPLLRKVLSHCVLPLVKTGALFGEDHRRNREQRKVAGTASMASISRRFLKMLFGWYRSGAAFDAARMRTCASAYRKAA